MGIFYLPKGASRFFFLNVSAMTNNVTISTCNLFTTFGTTIQVGGNWPGGFNNGDAKCLANGTQPGKQSTVVLTNLPSGYNFTINGTNSNDGGLFAVSIDCDNKNPREFNPNGNQNIPSVAPYPFYSNYTILDCANLTNMVTNGSSVSGILGGTTSSSGVSMSSILQAMSSAMTSTGTGTIVGSTGNGATTLSASPLISLILGAILFVVAC